MGEDKPQVPRPIHPFPARMAAAIPWKELCGQRKPRLRVLDPMAGSGTTIAVARTLGHHGIGFDTDPLAVLIARVWCANIPESSVLRSAGRIHEAAGECARTLRLRDAYPDGADEETKAFVRYWFDETGRRQLTALARAISSSRREEVRAVLWCAFSRLIITKQASASLALDLAHSRPHRVDDRVPIRPFKFFMKAVNAVLKAAPFRADGAKQPSASVRLGDARRLPLDDESIDVVITSPPYVNALDYLRAHKFSLIWMGDSLQELREIRASNVGTEIALPAKLQVEHVTSAVHRMGEVERLPDRYQRMLARYVHDMDAVLGEIARVLKSDGRALLVVGDSTMRSVYVRNSQALSFLAERHGLELESSRRRPLPANRRYLPPPSKTSSGAQLQSRMRTEVLLTLRKPA